MKIEILKSKGCKHCEDVINQIKEMEKEFEGLEVEVIDVIQKPEYLEKYPIMSSPGVVLDGELLYEGAVNIEELRKKISQKQG